MVSTPVIVTIGHLYPRQMNVYGDMGNIITLRYRLEARGYSVVYKPLASASDIDDQIDILVGGGGQDSNQSLVQRDLLRSSAELKARFDAGLTGLMICGMYQMMGEVFVTSEGEEIEGINYLPLRTVAGARRMIGNVVIRTDFGDLVGFENHSGATTLSEGLSPLGTVIQGGGNNGVTKDEGVRYRNLIGTYMHGPALAKNPRLADHLIVSALANRGVTDLIELDDTYESKASEIARKRPY